MSRMEKKTTLKLSPITFKDAKDFIISEGKGIGNPSGDFFQGHWRAYFKGEVGIVRRVRWKLN